MKDATYIKVKEGKLWASDMMKPSLNTMLSLATYNRAMEAFNQSFREVGNPEFLYRTYVGLPMGGGILPAPSGLQFEVRYDNPCIKLKKCMAVYNCAQLHGNQCQAEVKVAILSLKQEQPSEEKDHSVIQERLMNAFYKSLQWEDGEISGVDMIQLEQRISGILKSKD